MFSVVNCVAMPGNRKNLRAGASQQRQLLARYGINVKP
jgi:hypothetical protein